jgi:hypothetical protein
MGRPKTSTRAVESSAGRTGHQAESPDERGRADDHPGDGVGGGGDARGGVEHGRRGVAAALHVGEVLRAGLVVRRELAAGRFGEELVLAGELVGVHRGEVEHHHVAHDLAEHLLRAAGIEVLHEREFRATLADPQTGAGRAQEVEVPARGGQGVGDAVVVDDHAKVVAPAARGAGHVELEDRRARVEEGVGVPGLRRRRHHRMHPRIGRAAGVPREAKAVQRESAAALAVASAGPAPDDATVAEIGTTDAQMGLAQPRAKPPLPCHARCARGQSRVVRGGLVDGLGAEALAQLLEAPGHALQVQRVLFGGDRGAALGGAAGVSPGVFEGVAQGHPRVGVHVERAPEVREGPPHADHLRPLLVGITREESVDGLARSAQGLADPHARGVGVEEVRAQDGPLVAGERIERRGVELQRGEARPHALGRRELGVTRGVRRGPEQHRRVRDQRRLRAVRDGL